MRSPTTPRRRSTPGAGRSTRAHGRAAWWRGGGARGGPREVGGGMAVGSEGAKDENNPPEGGGAAPRLASPPLPARVAGLRQADRRGRGGHRRGRVHVRVLRRL